LAIRCHSDWVKTIRETLRPGLRTRLRFDLEPEDISAVVNYREGVAFPARVGNMEAREKKGRGDKEREGR
jgi:hypothetical protein